MRVETGLGVLHLFLTPEPHVDREAAEAAVKAATSADATSIRQTSMAGPSRCRSKAV